ncbi:MAG: ABC transporter permease subunit [Anaerolineae bacterium]|nr:ABC transporter permease subunit [Anaerolineae bacterium]
MIGSIFRKTLFDTRKSTFGWGLVLALLGLLVVLMYPTIQGFEGLDKIIEALPPALKALTGDVKDFSSLEGLLATKFFSMGPLILAVYAVQFGAAGLAGEEQHGTMDLLMSAPVPRWQVVIEKFAAFALSLVVVLLITFLGVVVGVALTPNITVSWQHVFEATMNLAPIALTFGALTFLFSTSLPYRLPGGVIAVGMAVAFYMLHLMGQMSSALEPVQVINPFYYHGTRTLFDGMNWGNVIVLLAASAVLLAASVFTFERRDLKA